MVCCLSWVSRFKKRHLILRGFQISLWKTFPFLDFFMSKDSARLQLSQTRLSIHLINNVNTAFYTFISAYPADGFPPNNNYSNQGSWYNYPSNGYTGGYAAYPGAAGYWSNTNGPPSHSNMSTKPQSSQAMVQYPVCSSKQHSYLVQVNVSQITCLFSPVVFSCTIVFILYWLRVFFKPLFKILFKGFQWFV